MLGLAAAAAWDRDHRRACTLPRDPQVEVFPAAQVENALDRLQTGDVRYRFALDLSDLDQGLAA